MKKQIAIPFLSFSPMNSGGMDLERVYLYLYCNAHQHMGSGMGGKEEEMTGGQFQAPTGTSLLTSLSSPSSVVKVYLLSVIINTPLVIGVL